MTPEFVDTLPEEIIVTQALTKKRPGGKTTIQKRRASTSVKGKVSGNKTFYSEKEKLNVCCVFAVTGNSRRTAELTKVPEATIRAWKTQAWWHDVTSRIHEEQDEEISGKLTKLVDNAVNQINDRLEHGDFVYNPKLDKLIRKPVGARDVAAVAVMAVDKRQLLRGKATSRTEKIGVDERMKDLAAQFKKFAQAKEIVQDTSIEEK